MSIKVILADDHDVVREGIKAILESKTQDVSIVGEVSNGKEVLEMARTDHRADVYVIDISMPIMNGIETTEELMKIDPTSKVIILSMHGDLTFVENAFKSGAKGYVLKENVTEELIQAIHDIYEDDIFVSPRISRAIVHAYLGNVSYRKENKVPDKALSELTTREKEILCLIAEGISYKEIAGKLNLSINTVYNHRSNLMRKLDIHKQSDLVRYSLKEGISRPLI